MASSQHEGRGARTLSRREVERLTAQVAPLHGWRQHHLLVADRLRAGYPFGFATDVLVRGDRAVFVFYTSVRLPPTNAQQAWISDLARVRVVEPIVAGPEHARELVRMLESAPRENAA